MSVVDWSKPITFKGWVDPPKLRVLCTDAPSHNGECVLLMDVAGAVHRRRLDGTSALGHPVVNIPPPLARRTLYLTMYRVSASGEAYVNKSTTPNYQPRPGNQVIARKTVELVEGEGL